MAIIWEEQTQDLTLGQSLGTLESRLSLSLDQFSGSTSPSESQSDSSHPSVAPILCEVVISGTHQINPWLSERLNDSQSFEL